jgi:hypothetical protein
MEKIERDIEEHETCEEAEGNLDALQQRQVGAARGWDWIGWNAVGALFSAGRPACTIACNALTSCPIPSHALQCCLQYPIAAAALRC